MRAFTLLLLTIVGAATLAACKEDPVQPPPTTLSGTYVSTIIVVPGPTDGPDTASARGSYVVATIQPNHAVLCTTHWVGQDSVIVDDQTTGTYTVTGDTVRFQTARSTLLSANTWLIRGHTLVAAHSTIPEGSYIVLDKTVVLID